MATAEGVGTALSLAVSDLILATRLQLEIPLSQTLVKPRQLMCTATSQISDVQKLFFWCGSIELRKEFFLGPLTMNKGYHSCIISSSLQFLAYPKESIQNYNFYSASSRWLLQALSLLTLTYVSKCSGHCLSCLTQSCCNLRNCSPYRDIEREVIMARQDWEELHCEAKTSDHLRKQLQGLQRSLPCLWRVKILSIRDAVCENLTLYCLILYMTSTFAFYLQLSSNSSRIQLALVLLYVCSSFHVFMGIFNRVKRGESGEQTGSHFTQRLDVSWMEVLDV